MTQKIQAHKVTKPIQLLAAWLIGLVVIDSTFLTAANMLSVPDWAASVLVIAAVVNVPLFLVCIFLLQTRFRPEMQEDSYYSKYLEAQQQTFLKVSKETKDITLPSDEKKKLERYLASAVQDPNKIIQNSWQDLENTLKESIGINYTQPFELEDVLKDKLPGDRFKLFAEMKNLKNILGNLSESGVSTGTAIDFSESALKLSNLLKNFPAADWLRGEDVMRKYNLSGNELLQHIENGLTAYSKDTDISSKKSQPLGKEDFYFQSDYDDNEFLQKELPKWWFKRIDIEKYIQDKNKT